MCGIAGILAPAWPAPAARDAAARMLRTLRHRGPDGEGLHHDGPCVLAHSRLAIVDPGLAAQPMVSADRRFAIAFNGEIYNHDELADRLRARGFTLRTRSDTEALLEWLAHKGRDGLADVHGMFAFALWDRARQELLLARDRLGEKPLFYAEHAGGIAFASELKALRQLPALGATLHPGAVPACLAFGYIPAPATIYREVRKLEPGAWLTCGPDGIRHGRYWTLCFEPPPFAGPDEAADALRAALRDAVRSRLRSDAPLGLWLSGGVDSGAVAALAAAQAPLPSFSVAFDDPSHDETRFAHLVAGRCGTQHETIPLRAGDVPDLVPAALAAVDEPFADASLVPTFLLARASARRVKAVLGGDGGDEWFGGYPAFGAHAAAERILRVPGLAPALESFAGRLPPSPRYASPSFLLQHFAAALREPPERRLLCWLGPMGARQAARLLPDPASVPAALDAALAAALAGAPAEVERRLTAVCARTYLQDGILVKTDRAGMASSLEVRAPLLDHRLVELAARVPPPWKLRRGCAKWILKRAVRDLVPPVVLRRRKAGFMMPLAAYLRGPLRPMVEDLCSRAAVRRAGLLEPREVERLRTEHLGGRADHRKALWAVLCVQHWAQR